MKPSTRAHFRILGALSLLGYSSASWALSCDEIMNMVDVGVPDHIVVMTVKDSGEVFASADIQCLQTRGAPSSVVTQARSMMRSTAPASEPTPTREEPARGSSLETDSDDLGGRSGSTDLPERGGDDGDDPEKLKAAIKRYRAKKPLTASKMLYEILQDDAAMGQDTKVHYYLGRSLEALEMFHMAQHHYLQVIKAGTSDPYFNYALPKLVKIARHTGDDSELIKIAPQISPDAYPRGAKNHLFYLMGVREYNKGNLSAARKYFGQVSSKSPLYLNSEYFRGVIYNQQGKLKSAVRSFRDVYREDVEVYNDPRYLQDVEDLKDMALMNVARIYYAIERYDEASKYYDLVSRDSQYWPEALFENAWANFMQNNLNDTLGQILTVHSPFFKDDEWNPEATVLRALTFFNLCEYTEVEKRLIKFETDHSAMVDEMRTFVGSYSNQEALKLADQAWDAYFGRTERIDSVLPKSLFTKILRNKDLAGIVRHLEVLDEEEVLIDKQRSEWRDSVGVYLKQRIERDRQKYKKRAGRLFLRELARQANKLQDLLTQSEIIRFEVVDAQRVDYAYKAQNADIGDALGDLKIDFATSVEYIYWPFNGEFWADELGYYHYTEQGSCK
jgi:tetratricopeptide (TPR) repeat protein